MDLEQKVTLAAAEGIDLDVAVAGIGSRAAALLLDSFIQGIALWVLATVLGSLGDAGAGFLVVSVFLLFFGYPTLCEAFNGGRTVGKLALGIAVVKADGMPCTFLAAATRNVLRLIDILPGLYTVGLVSMFVTKQTQRLGDLAAGTIVVRQAKQAVGAVPAAPAPPTGVAGYAGPPVGAPAYGAPAYGAPAYGAPAYGAPVPAVGPAVGPPPPATVGYEAAGSGAPGYGAPGYGAPAYGAYAVPALPPEVAAWDTSALSVDEVALIRAFLVRRWELPVESRAKLGLLLGEQFLPKVAGMPLDGGPERLLERIAWVRSFR